MPKEKSVDSADLIEFLKITRTLVVQVKILEDLNIPDEQKSLARNALKSLVDAASEYLDEST